MHAVDVYVSSWLRKKKGRGRIHTDDNASNRAKHRTYPRLFRVRIVVANTYIYVDTFGTNPTTRSLHIYVYTYILHRQNNPIHPHPYTSHMSHTHTTPSCTHTHTHLLATPHAHPSIRLIPRKPLTMYVWKGEEM